MDRLYEKLTAYSREDYYPMHMPGHKRNIQLLPLDNPYAIDITEIEGFDNLHQAEGILKRLSERLDRLYGSKKAYPLVGGSTAGILAGISAAVQRGDKILLARNSHKSVYHAAVLRGLIPIYCYPQRVKDSTLNGGISPSDIEELLITHGDIRLIVITSPTYEGMVSDISSIASVAHKHGALLLVDEAHGAHFGFHEAFPKSAVTQGADLVIQSLHKTLPAFTQTAVLHCNCEKLYPKLEKYLAIYQSSSPSYVLLAGIDRCVSLLEDHSRELFQTYQQRLTELEQGLQGLKHLKLIGRQAAGADCVFAVDASKLLIFTGDTALTGHRLGEILRTKYHIVMELEASDYVLAMTSICDTKEGFERLQEALVTIDQELSCNSSGALHSEYNNVRCPQGHNLNIDTSKPLGIPEQVMSPSEAMELPSEVVMLSDSAGRVSATFVALFPPGSPILVPGERIEKELLLFLDNMMEEGLSVTGLCKENADKIEVLTDISLDKVIKQTGNGKDSENG